MVRIRYHSNDLLSYDDEPPRTFLQWLGRKFRKSKEKYQARSILKQVMRAENLTRLGKFERALEMVNDLEWWAAKYPTNSTLTRIEKVRNQCESHLYKMSSERIEEQLNLETDNPEILMLNMVNLFNDLFEYFDLQDFKTFDIIIYDGILVQLNKLEKIIQNSNWKEGVLTLQDMNSKLTALHKEFEFYKQKESNSKYPDMAGKLLNDNLGTKLKELHLEWKKMHKNGVF